MERFYLGSTHRIGIFCCVNELCVCWGDDPPPGRHAIFRRLVSTRLMGSRVMSWIFPIYFHQRRKCGSRWDCPVGIFILTPRGWFGCSPYWDINCGSKWGFTGNVYACATPVLAYFSSLIHLRGEKIVAASDVPWQTIYCNNKWVLTKFTGFGLFIAEILRKNKSTSSPLSTHNVFRSIRITTKSPAGFGCINNIGNVGSSLA